MVSSDNEVELRKLADLRDRGVLTPSEYEAQQEIVLRQPVTAPARVAVSSGQPQRRPRMAERSNFTALLAVLCAIVFWPAGITLGYQARKQARQRGEGDDRLALIALVIGYAAAILTLTVIIVKAST